MPLQPLVIIVQTSYLFSIKYGQNVIAYIYISQLFSLKALGVHVNKKSQRIQLFWFVLSIFAGKKKVSSVYSTVAMLSVNTERWLLDFSIAEISDAIKCHWITKSDRGHDWDKQKVPSQSKTNKTQRINQFCHSQFILTNL